MDTHVKVVALLHIIVGVIGCMTALFLLCLFGGLATFLAIGVQEPLPSGILGLLGVGLAFFMILTSIPGVIGGFGLLNQAEWARLLIIVVSIFYIPFWIPLGTALGVYSLIVLFNPEIQSVLASPMDPNQQAAPSAREM
jgi:hypothetical protein